jgi:hypothetical protein
LEQARKWTGTPPQLGETTRFKQQQISKLMKSRENLAPFYRLEGFNLPNLWVILLDVLSGYTQRF